MFFFFFVAFVVSWVHLWVLFHSLFLPVSFFLSFCAVTTAPTTSTIGKHQQPLRWIEIERGLSIFTQNENNFTLNSLRDMISGIKYTTSLLLSFSFHVFFFGCFCLFFLVCVSYLPCLKLWFYRKYFTFFFFHVILCIILCI